MNHYRVVPLETMWLFDIAQKMPKTDNHTE
jgi:hypothetical protein